MKLKPIPADERQVKCVGRSTGGGSSGVGGAAGSVRGGVSAAGGPWHAALRVAEAQMK